MRGIDYCTTALARQVLSNPFLNASLPPSSRTEQGKNIRTHLIINLRTPTQQLVAPQYTHSLTDFRVLRRFPMIMALLGSGIAGLGAMIQSCACIVRRGGWAC